MAPTDRGKKNKNKTADTEGEPTEALLLSVLRSESVSAADSEAADVDKDLLAIEQPDVVITSLRGTIYEDAAVYLAAALATARAKDTNKAFAQVMNVALDLRRMWTAAELADRIGVATSTLSKWRSSDRSPRDFMRRAALREMATRLREMFGDDVGRGGAALFEYADDLDRALRRAILAAAHRRLHKPEAIESPVAFALSLRLCRELRVFLNAAELAKGMSVHESTLSRWSSDDQPEARLAVRKASVFELRVLVDQKLSEMSAMTPVVAIAGRRP